MKIPTEYQLFKYGDLARNLDLSNQLINTTVLSTPRQSNKDIYNKLLKSPVDKWLSNNSNYKTAVKSFYRTNAYKSSLNKKHIESRLRGAICHIFSGYVGFKENPKRLKPIPSRKIYSALTHAEKLLQLVDEGVQLDNYDSTRSLSEHLIKLISDIKNCRLPTQQRLSKGNYVDQYLIIGLDRYLKSVFDEDMTTVVIKTAAIISDVNERSANRYLKHHREKHRNT